MNRQAARIATIYALSGAIWILLGNELLSQWVKGGVVLTRLLPSVGLSFVFVSALLIYVLTLRGLRRQGQVENELFRHDERWRLALAGAGDGIWDWDATSDALFLSTRYKEMLGYDEDDFPNVIGNWEAILHPEDREFAIRSINDHLSGRTPLHYAEFRLRCKDDSWKWILGRGRVVARDSEGRPLRIVGTHTDITVLKLAQQALQTTENQMREQFDSLPTAMLLLDADSARIADSNFAAQSLFGYDAAALHEMSLADLTVWPEVVLPLPCTSASFEARYRRSDGSVMWADVCAAPQRSADGAVARLSLGILDVTERKAAREAAAASDRRYRELFQNMLDGVAHCRTIYRGRAAVDFEFLGVNASFSRLTGLVDVVGRRASELIPGLRGSCPALFATRGLFNEQGASEKQEIYVEALQRWYSITLYSPAPDEFIAVFEDISLRKAAEERSDFLAFHDPLTGLPNRRRVRERLEDDLRLAREDGGAVTVFFIDFDHFKTINDSLGHAVGDVFLQTASRRLQSSLRDGDTLARLGGDEFLLVLKGVADRATLARRADDLIARMAEPFRLEQHELSLSASIGIACCPGDGEDYDTLLSKADAAMFSAKESGRNGWCFFDASMSADADNYLAMYAGLHRALDRGEFIIEYQPQVELGTRRVLGAEALVRWRSPERGLLSPERFIGVAETSGLIVPIGAWILNEVCRQAVIWRKSGLPGLVLAVNLSAVQFRRGDLERTVIDALATSGLDPSALELELTESTLVDDTENVLLTLSRLRELGVRLSIDDFGTGYSSFTYLRRFVIDKIKIDQSFIRSMRVDRNDAAIAHAIIKMARIMGVRTLAEGVEDEAVAEMLRTFRCNEAQGFLYGRPMRADDFTHFLHEATSGEKA
ncbi:sensor domain-containing protein [Paludibacterium yongneupense]|uniref:sensor domain-containing protein n=1 Tax=Paludibacterium yongneupense TaxID=400061 RepID=UPI0004297D56|nr:EAL domain-containing protein [Paludibacterium yongneupense]